MTFLVVLYVLRGLQLGLGCRRKVANKGEVFRSDTLEGHDELSPIDEAALLDADDPSLVVVLKPPVSTDKMSSVFTPALHSTTYLNHRSSNCSSSTFSRGVACISWRKRMSQRTYFAFPRLPLRCADQKTSSG